MYPRDSAAVGLIQDGRWKQPPNPVDWQIMPELAGAVAMRRGRGGTGGARHGPTGRLLRSRDALR